MEAIEYNASDLARVIEQSEYRGAPDVTVTDIVYDSRKVRPGALFVCWKGAHYDGHAFAPDAVYKGARALLCERYLDTLHETAQIIVPDTRRALGPLAATFYGAPSDRLRLIGVTGTNGKTTTTYLINGILKAGHIRAGLIGTIESLIGSRSVPSQRTTPEAPDIQRLLAQMVDEGCNACTMEVSSHGIDLHRIDGCTFSVGVFTNLSQDHLDYHATFDAYRRAKVRLFERLTEAAVINADDQNAAHFAAGASVPVLRYGVKSPDADFRATDIRLDPSGTTYTVHTPAGSFDVRLALTGLFNVYNSLAAIAVAYHLGIEPKQVAEGLAGVQVPGRFERVSVDHPVSVIVDYAHTPDGLENVLRAARAISQGRVVVVFGAGGDRDRGKRPLMGRVAVEGADLAVITSDNPRSEDPRTICEEIEAGIEMAGVSKDRYVRIEGRREAIRHAIQVARPGDMVLIAGKGHETYQEIQGVREHFDDREEARAALEERFGHAAAHTP